MFPFLSRTRAAPRTVVEPSRPVSLKKTSLLSDELIEAPTLRIRDLSHLEASFRGLANEAERAPMRDPQHRDLILTLTMSDRVLAEAHASARMGHQRELVAKEDGLDPARLAGGAEQQIRRARLSLKSALDDVQALEPNRPGKKGVYHYPSAVVMGLRQAADAVARAEEASSAVPDPDRNRLLEARSDVLRLPASAYEEADRDPGLVNAATRDHFQLQRTLRKRGPLLTELLLGGRMEVFGVRLPTDRPYILCFTHGHGVLDGPAVLGTLVGEGSAPLRTVMRSFDGLRGALLRKALLPAGIIPIKFGKGRGAAGLVVMDRVLGRGHPLGIAGEGRVVQNDTVGTLRDGVARTGLSAQVDIYPVAIQGEKPSGVEAAPGHGGLKAVIGDPVSTQGFAPTPHNVGVTRDEVQRKLVEAWDFGRRISMGLEPDAEPRSAG